MKWSWQEYNNETTLHQIKIRWIHVTSVIMKCPCWVRVPTSPWASQSAGTGPKCGLLGMVPPLLLLLKQCCLESLYIFFSLSFTLSIFFIPVVNTHSFLHSPSFSFCLDILCLVMPYSSMFVCYAVRISRFRWQLLFVNGAFWFLLTFLLYTSLV